MYSRCCFPALGKAKDKQVFFNVQQPVCCFPALGKAEVLTSGCWLFTCLGKGRVSPQKASSLSALGKADELQTSPGVRKDMGGRGGGGGGRMVICSLGCQCSIYIFFVQIKPREFQIWEWLLRSNISFTKNINKPI